MSIILPKTYKNDSSGRYPEHVGKPKISYSQYTSWKDEKYRDEYIRHYFFGGPRSTNQFAEFGSACGKYFEDQTVDSNWLSEDDVKVLQKLHRPENAKYEVEIVIDMEEYCIQGFIDQEYEEDGLIVNDLKSGNINTKVKFYGGQNYQQTTLYSHARHLEGQQIKYSGVTLLGRKGDGGRWGKLRLSGDIEKIPTPYTNERAQVALKDVTKEVYAISDLYKIYLKIVK